MTLPPRSLPLRTPAPLVRLLLVLSATTGMVDAAGILGMGGVFAANTAGNVVFAALASIGAPGFALVPCLAALAAFIAGAVAAGRIGRRGSGNPARPGRWLARAAVTEGAMLILVGLLALYLRHAGALPGGAILGVIAVTAGAMGFRSAVVRQLRVPDLSAAGLALTVTGLAADSRAAPGESTGASRRVRLCGIAMLFAGAAAGAALVMTAGLGVTLLVTGMIVLAATLLFVRHPQMSEIERP